MSTGKQPCELYKQEVLCGGMIYPKKKILTSCNLTSYLTPLPAKKDFCILVFQELHIPENVLAGCL
jgi:hypothetical protein